MDRINIVILADETEYRVAVKNKIKDGSLAIVGYSDFDENSRLKIEGYFPDVVVCAVNSSTIDDQLFDFIKSLQFQSSGCAVVLMTDNVSVRLVNEAAKVGIRQVYSFDMDPEDFCKSIVEVNQLEQQLLGQLKIEKRVRSKVLGFYGVKGGAGTSSVATNVAVTLANKGKKVLLLDFNLQFGNDSYFLNMEPKDTIVELARDPEGISIEKVNTTAEMHSTGLTVLCAPKSPEFAEYVTPEHIQKIIENVRPYFEYILIDLGANFADQTLTAIENCDEIHLITNLDILCLRGTKCAMNVLDSLRVADKVQLVVNKLTASLLKVKDFENLIERHAYATITSDRRICTNALNSGLTFVTDQPRSAVAKDLVKYVDKIIEEKERV